MFHQIHRIMREDTQLKIIKKFKKIKAVFKTFNCFILIDSHTQQHTLELPVPRSTPGNDVQAACGTTRNTLNHRHQ